LTARASPSPAVVAAIAGPEPLSSPWAPAGGATGFRLNAASVRRWRLFVDGEPGEFEVDFAAARPPSHRDGERMIAFEGGAALALSLHGEAVAGAAAGAGDGIVRAPMPGRLIAVPVRRGEKVKAGDPLVVLEAMKMEHALTAPFAGTVEEVAARPGDQVIEGAVLIRLKPSG
jgi:3-methylcrotonyl-CoA carboxylase alpha subunit